nr:immunoglobulin light chain junction region [Macaca mulatta]MPO06423.1 immunoglobulin light chain junction region [Macaca mulatta]
CGADHGTGSSFMYVF